MLELVTGAAVGYLAGYFLMRLDIRRASKEAAAAAMVSENTAKYRRAVNAAYLIDGYSGVPDARGVIWSRVAAPFDTRLDLSCDEFVEWQRSKGLVQ